MNNDKKALKSGIWYTASNFLVKSIGFLTTPIFTRLLTKEEFGLFNNFTSWLSIISIFSTLNLESTLISARYDYKENFDNYILSMISLSTLSTCVWALVINIFSIKVCSFTNIDLKYFNIMMVYFLFFPAINMFQTRERYYFEYKKSVVTSIILSVGTALLSVLLVCMGENRLEGRIYGFVLPSILLGFAFEIYFIKKGKRVSIKYWKYAFPICLPFIPHLLAGVLLNNMDRIMINKWCGAEATALYSLAYSCGAIITLLVNSINSAYAPWLGEKLALKKLNDVRQISKIYVGGFCIFALGVMLLAPEILLVLGGKNYMDAIYVIIPVAMGCVCQFLYTMFGNVEQFKKKTAGMAIATVTAAIVNYVLNYLFIPRFGFLAAAYTTLVGYLCLLIIHMFIVWKLGLSCLYDYQFIFGVVVVGIVMSTIITISFNYLYFRFVLIVVYAIFVGWMFIKNKDKLFKLLNKKVH